MLELYKKGARTIAQDEESSVVFGMPKEAINIGAAEATVSLTKIANIMADFSNEVKNK
jgi:two-component system chemotaxis response regulator CheB